MTSFQPWLDSHCRDILDDCDFTLAVKTQLNYPSGPEIAVDGNAYRWTVAQELLALVAYYVPTLQERLPSAVSLTPTTDYLPPHQGCAVVLPPSTQCYGRHLTQEALRSIFERLYPQIFQILTPLAQGIGPLHKQKHTTTATTREQKTERSLDGPGSKMEANEFITTACPQRYQSPNATLKLGVRPREHSGAWQRPRPRRPGPGGVP